MRAFVFTDKALSRQAGRFVWLEMDTEKAQNAALRKRFSVQALPTFLVVDPDSERVVLRWVGGATVPQLEKILDEARRAWKRGGTEVAARGGDAKSAPGTAGSPGQRASDAALRAANEALARADRAYGAGDNAAAAKAYQEALAVAPARWPAYSRAVESLLFALSDIEAYAQGARLARAAFPKLEQTSSAANVAGTGLDCALQMPADSTARADLVAALEADARRVVDDPKIPVAADDRSAVYLGLLEARKDAKDEAGAKRIAAGWAAFLEREAGRARTAEARTVFDSHRLSAYIELGQPERAIPVLQASERDLPDDYNPPARLAVAYKAMQRWDDALAASDRALAKAYGPRQLGILQTRADIYKGCGDMQQARRTLEDALQLAGTLPPGQRSESTIASLKKKIEALRTTP